MSASRERVFSESFIRAQRNLFNQEFESLGGGLLTSNGINDIFAYMQDLHIDLETGRISGNQHGQRNYFELIHSIDDLIDKGIKTKLGKNHPSISPLTHLKHHIQEFIKTAQHPYAEELKGIEEKSDRSKSEACCNIVKDTAGILACLAWVVPEKILSCCNGCDCPCCTTPEPCCAEVPLPRKIEGAETYVSCWAPINSIKALCNDIEAQIDTIQQENQAPIRHVMR